MTIHASSACRIKKRQVQLCLDMVPGFPSVATMSVSCKNFQSMLDGVQESAFAIS